ncbi:hypothetical protein HOT61_gp095 [Salmonella phage S116]|uniref:Uncharacterized protein n=1 Tax=Salmonella phage S116 TaxID=2231345 RepID=A0A2Z5HL42_9CAUD|nr:hypothetical protein HOT61_gp095 [Salmonella phage S116]AXC40693.1 hypothetical protein [Salmonella phage S116]
MKLVTEFTIGHCKVAFLNEKSFNNEETIGIFEIKEDEYERVERLAYLFFADVHLMNDLKELVFRLPKDIPFTARNMSHIVAQLNLIWIKLDPAIDRVITLKERPIKKFTGDQACDI